MKIIDYIVEHIYVHGKIKSIYSKLIFKKLLLKRETECKFTFASNYYGCTMGAPSSLLFNDIYMVKMENEVVTPIKPTFYRKYVDNIFN